MPNHLLLALAGLLIATVFAMPHGGFDSGVLFGIYAALLLAAASLGSAAWRLSYAPAVQSPQHEDLRAEKRWRCLFLCAALLYVLALSAATAISPFTAVIAEQALAMGLLPVGYLVARASLRAGIAWQQLWEIFRLLAAAMAVMALVERLLTGGRAYTVLLDPNVLAGLFNVFVLTGFIKLVLRLRYGATFGSCAADCALLMLFAAAQGVTGSLSGLLCLLAAMLPLSILAVRGLPARRAGTVLGAAILAMLLAVACSGGTAEPPTTKLQGIAQHSSFTVRLEMAQASLAIYRDSAWYGSGLGTFKLYYPRYRGLLDSGSAGNLVHNDYVQFLQEGGPLLLGSLLLIALLILARASSALYSGWRNGPTEPLLMQAGISAALLALLLHGGMNFIFYSSPLALLFGVLMAKLAPTPEIPEPAPASSGQTAVFFAVVAALAIALISTLGARGLFITLTQARCEFRVCQALRSDVAFVKQLSAYLAGTQKTWIPVRDYLIINNLRTAESQTDTTQKALWRANAFREALSLVQDTPELSGAYITLIEIIKMDKTLAKLMPEGLATNVAGLYQLALIHNPLDLGVRLQLAAELHTEDRDAEAYTALNKIMPYWNLQSWGDSGRMSLLAAAIPLAASLHHCKDAAEMAAGLGVFLKLQKEAAAADVKLAQASDALSAPTTEETEKAMLLAANCN